MLKKGDAVPDFEAHSISGERFSSKKLKGKRYVIYFYPKDFSPGCDACARSLRDNYQTFQKSDIQIFGVSGEPLKTRQKYKEKYNLPYILLLDEDHSLAKNFGVYVQKTMLGKKYMGLERTTFLVNEEGKIEEIFGGPGGLEKVKTLTHGNQILEFYHLK